jgi:folate-binding protein YgfZ
MNFATSAGIFRWQPAAWLKITGADAASFLQGQFTNDLRGLRAGEARYGLWLDVKGKVTADSFVVRDAVEDAYWVGSYDCAGSVVRERLERFVIADDVVVEDATDEWTAVTVFGEGVTVAGVSDGRIGCVFPGRRGGGEHLEWVFRKTAQAEAMKLIEGRVELPAAEIERRRIMAGVPRVPVDVGPSDLPNEGGLEREAISFTKGCYLGQEVMARLQAMGRVRRRLTQVVVAGPVPGALPVPLFVGERQVGELRSAVETDAGRVIGLAMVSLLQVSAETKMSFAVGEPAVVGMLLDHD